MCKRELAAAVRKKRLTLQGEQIGELWFDWPQTRLRSVKEPGSGGKDKQ